MIRIWNFRYFIHQFVSICWSKRALVCFLMFQLCSCLCADYLFLSLILSRNFIYLVVIDSSCNLWPFKNNRFFFFWYNKNVILQFTWAIFARCFSIFFVNLIITYQYFSWIFLKIFTWVYDTKTNRMTRSFTVR